MLILLDVFDTRSRQNDPGGFEKKVTILAFKAQRRVATRPRRRPRGLGPTTGRLSPSQFGQQLSTESKFSDAPITVESTQKVSTACTVTNCDTLGASLPACQPLSGGKNNTDTNLHKATANPWSIHARLAFSQPQRGHYVGRWRGAGY